MARGPAPASPMSVGAPLTAVHTCFYSDGVLLMADAHGEVCVYGHVCVWACMCVYVYVVFVYVICVCLYVVLYMCMCMCSVCVYVYVYSHVVAWFVWGVVLTVLYACVCMCVHVCAWVCMCVHVCVCAQSEVDFVVSVSPDFSARGGFNEVVTPVPVDGKVWSIAGACVCMCAVLCAYM